MLIRHPIVMYHGIIYIIQLVHAKPSNFKMSMIKMPCLKSYDNIVITTSNKITYENLLPKCFTSYASHPSQ
jgi:hypothetical protein